jgi:hypothetical protein
MVCDVLVKLRARRFNLSQSEEAAGMGFNVCSWSSPGVPLIEFATTLLSLSGKT